MEQIMKPSLRQIWLWLRRKNKAIKLWFIENNIHLFKDFDYYKSSH